MSANTGNNSLESTSKRTLTFKELFSLATPFDIMLMVIGSIGSMGMGVTMPVFNKLFGEIMNQLNDSGSNIEEIVGQVALIFVCVGIGTIFFGYMVSWFYYHVLVICTNVCFIHYSKQYVGR